MLFVSDKNGDAHEQNDRSIYRRKFWVVNFTNFTKLSFIICGLGNIVNKQIAKGLAFLVLEIAYIYYMINNGIVSIQNFITLGVKEQGEVYNEQLGIYVVKSIGNSGNNFDYSGCDYIIVISESYEKYGKSRNSQLCYCKAI